MYSAVIAPRSLLLTQYGWNQSHLSNGYYIAGIDRHGKLSHQPVTITKCTVPEYEIFLGTGLCCGHFLASSVVQDSTGRAINLKDLALRGSLHDLRFEALVSGGPLVLDQNQIELLWLALTREAAFKSEHRIAIRCRSSGLRSAELQGEIGEFERIQGRTYYFLDKQAMGVEIAGLLSDIETVFEAEEGFRVFLRDSVALPMIMAASCFERGQSYEFIYDAHQYTGTLSIRSPARSAISVTSGRCVQVLELREGMQLSWRESMWNPICNGLILEAR